MPIARWVMVYTTNIMLFVLVCLVRDNDVCNARIRLKFSTVLPVLI